MAETLSSVAIKDFNNSSRSMRTVEDSASGIHVSGVDNVPTSMGGLDVYSTIAASGAENAIVVKAAAGKLYGYRLINADAASPAFVFLKLYDKATAPTSSDTPKMRIGASGTTTPAIGEAKAEFPAGIAFSNGISLRIASTMADNSTTYTFLANEVIVELYYK